MEAGMSKGKTVGGFLLAPLIAAGASLAAGAVAKKGPKFVEDTLLPWLREALEGAGSAAEKVPDKARSAVSSGGDLAEQLTDRVRDATGLGDSGSTDSGGGLSPDELTSRSEDRAKRRAKRRKATKKK
jgi:hypothetical protein